MIPLRDNIPSRRFPLMNLLLIAVNFLVFFHELSLGKRALYASIMTYGVVPAHLLEAVAHPSPTSGQVYATLVTAQFLHGGWLHIVGNMLFLWVFGDNVEDRMGRLRYLVFYLLVGALANLVFALAQPGSLLPTIGASGAIAGVLGAYLVAYPRARVMTLVILVVFVTIVQLPAWVFLLYWFFLQVTSGFASLSATAAQASGVAWWAHIGGFVFGAALIPLFQQYGWRPRPE